MSKISPGSLVSLAVLALIGLAVCVAPRAEAASQASAYPLAPGNEFLALTVTPENDAFVATSKFGGPYGDVYEGAHVFEIEPGGNVQEFPSFVRGDIAQAGIAAGPSQSAWLPTERGIARVGENGLAKQIPLAHGEINALTTDFRGGIWVLTPLFFAHVDAGGTLRRFPSAFPRQSGCCAAPTSVIADEAGDVWFTVVRGMEPLTKEVVERKADGQIRHFRIGTRFPSSTAIGVSAADGRLIVQSEHSFLEIDMRTRRSRRISVPNKPCFTTQIGEIWCHQMQGLVRVCPRHAQAAASLPRPGFRTSQLSTTTTGSFWYVAENRKPCRSGPSTCSTEAPGTVVVGDFAATLP
jgi:ligand-binding sensor domain-containing protein